MSWRQLIDQHHRMEHAEHVAMQFYYHTIERQTWHAWKLVDDFVANESHTIMSLLLLSILVCSTWSINEINVSTK
jgi:hypothetical protein